MKKIAKILKVLISILCPVVAILFIVYFWNLDQKVLAGMYKGVNKVFDEKPVDIKF